MIWIGAAITLAVGLFAAIRLAPLTDGGRQMIVAMLNGVQLGPLGRLQIGGLSGDFWSDFTLTRLAVADQDGPWLQAGRVHVRWSPSRLLRRRAQIDQLEIDRLILLRRPIVSAGASGGQGAPPLSIFINDARLGLETRPAFSVARGLFQIQMNLDIARKGGVAGQIRSRNLLQPGDGLEARFDLGVGKKVQLDAHAHDSRGGALAGILGLPVSRALYIDAKASGDLVQGSSHVQALSGALPIAKADGVWSKAGGGLNGWISLAASTWTAPLQHALGPQLNFAFGHTQTQGDLRNLTLRLWADNGALTVAGPLDLQHRRSDQGMTVTAGIKDLSRIVPRPVVGAARLTGVWKGRDLDWDLTGRAGVKGLGLGDYALADASGPVRLSYRARELRLVAAAGGTGGKGAGLICALAGAQPQASLDVSRLADGRLLLHTVKLGGAGLKLDASGAKGLLGDLSFKGGVILTNLAAARPGAKGTVTANWSVSQFRARQPWKFSAQMTGAGLATGLVQADHLLGPQPQLRIEAAYDNGALDLARAELIGAAGRLTAKGAATRAGVLNFTLDAGGQGPLGFGPVAIGGRFHGAGTVTGSVATPRAELSADVERADLPRLSLSGVHLAMTAARDTQGAGGHISITGTSAGGDAHARGDFRLAGDRLDLSAIDLVGGGLTAQGALDLRHWALADADLSVTAGPGALIDQGRVEAQLRVSDAVPGSDQQAAVSLTASDLKLRGEAAVVREAKLTANGPMAHLPYVIETEIDADQAPLQLKGAGVASDAGPGLALTFNGAGRFRSTDFHTLSPAGIALNGADRTAQLDLSVGGGRAQIKARQTGDGLAANATMTGVDLATLGEGLAGQFDADLSLSGQASQLSGRLNARLIGARSRDAPSKLALNGAVTAELNGGRLTLDAAVDGASTRDHATLHAILPAATAAAPFHFALNRDQPISGELAANGDVQPIWDMFFGGERELGGQLTAHLNLAGDLAAPRFTGHGLIDKGLFEDAATGLKLRDLSAEADLGDDALILQRFSAKDAHAGTLAGAGRLSLAGDGASTLTLKAHGFQLLDNETAKATASGAVTVVRGGDGKAKLSGDLVIDRADIQAASARAPPGVITMDVIERNKPGVSGPTIHTAPVSGPALALDVRVTASRHIFVKGLGLDAELSLNAQVVGDTSAPVLQGKARVVRGIYNFAGKRFDIDDTGVVDLASSPDQIRLNLSATLTDPTLTAVIEIKGTAAKPLITLTSTPVLPSDEILSEVLFGQSAAQLSPVEAAQLAAAVTTLATGGGFDVMGGLGGFARLDRLALGGTSATGVTVSGGKYIGNNVYLELTGGGLQGPSAQVEIRATRSLSLISQLGGDVGAQLSVRWRHDFGKPPAAK